MEGGAEVVAAGGSRDHAVAAGDCHAPFLVFLCHGLYLGGLCRFSKMTSINAANESRDSEIAPTAFFKWLVGRRLAIARAVLSPSLFGRLIVIHSLDPIQMYYICCVILGRHAIMNPRHAQHQPRFFGKSVLGSVDI